MKRIILSLAVFLFAAAAWGQLGIPPGVVTGNPTPGGACDNGPGQIVTSTGTIYTCVSGVWTSTGTASFPGVSSDGANGLLVVGSVKAGSTGSGYLSMTGGTSGAASLSVLAVAGTPSTVLLPPSDPSEGQVLTAHVPAACSGAPTVNCTQLYWSTPSGIIGPARTTGCAVQSASSLTTNNCTVSGLVGGETIVVDLYRFQNPTFTSLVDSAGGSFVQLDTHTFNSNGYDVYYLVNAAAGSHTITLTVGTAKTFLGLFVDVISGVPTASPFDGSPTFFSFISGNCPATETGTPITVAASGEMVFAFGTTAGAGPLTVGAGYTLYGGAPFTNIARESMTTSAAGSVVASFGGMNTASPIGCTIETMALKAK